MIDKIKAYLAENWSDFQAVIASSLSSDIELLNKLNQSMLANSGKQLRPLMSILMARAISGKSNADTLKYAAAAELLHNATLFHDDVADQSDTRRGKPTLRALMGPQVSVLVGDFWLVKAVSLIMSAELGWERAVRLFADTLSDLVEGEMLQLQKTFKCDTSQDDYLRIIYGKTASLFVVSSKIAAISVAAAPEMEQAAVDYARNVGYAFQIKDDILDYSGDSQVGKALGVDILESKITLPLLGAFAHMEPDKEAKLREAISRDPAGASSQAHEAVRALGGIEYAYDMLKDYVNKAISALNVLPDSQEKYYLIKLAEYIAVRKK